MKKLTKNQWTNIILGIVGLIVLWLAYKVIIKGQSINDIFGGLPTKKDDTQDSPSTGTNPTTGGNTGSQTSFTDSTVFSLKNPRMKNERVQWMQYRYNKYARARKEKGRTPDWPTITEDGIFGPNTESAINRIMGKKSASWSEVRQRADYLHSQLGSSSSNQSSSTGAPTFAGSYHNQQYYHNGQFWTWNAYQNKWVTSINPF
jgi:hypothetical protein